MIRSRSCSLTSSPRAAPTDVQLYLTFLGLEPDRQQTPLDVEANVTRLKRVPGAPLGFARRFPYWWRITRRVPTPIRDIARRPISRPLPEMAGLLPPDVCRQLRTHLQSEVEMIAPFLPNGFDGWGLAP